MSTLTELLEGTPGLTNPEALNRWRTGIQTSLNSGGVDVLFLGDSIANGTGATDYWMEGLPHMVKLRLQNELNPSGVTGGYGFIPASDGSAVYGSGTTGSSKFIISFNTSSGVQSYTDDTDGFGDRSLSFHNNGSDTLNVLFYNFDESATTVAHEREKMDYFEVQYKADATYGTLSVDVSSSSGATPSRGGGSPTGSIDQSVVSGGTWGMRSSAFNVSTNTQAAMRIALRPPATSSTVCSLDGIIVYYQDYYKGVRVHRCANPGSRLLNWSDNTLAATVAPFCTMAYGGARNCKAVVISDVINTAQALGAGTEVIAQHKTRWKEIIRYIIAQPSSPSILIMFPPKIVIGASIAAFVTNDTWDLAINAWRDIAAEINDENGEQLVAILDYNQYSGLSVADQTDEVHNTSAQQAQMSEIMAGVFIAAATAA